MSIKFEEAERWERTAGAWSVKNLSDKLLGEHRRKAHLELMARWADVSSVQRILKTDLFEEAFGTDQLLFDLARVSSNVIGMDISRKIARRAKRAGKKYGVEGGEYLCCDVRRLPFRDNSIDLVVSTSTLDHFHEEAEIVTSLKELYRVISVGGTLIITLDNKDKLGEPLRRLWMLLGLAPFFIGKTYSIKELESVLKGVGFRVEAATAIIHQPMFFLKLFVRCLHGLSAGRFDPLIKKLLASQDNLEKKRTKYLTGLYVAVKAVKA
jgi:ubiquinone/menaquinone biosynthesis C-methylase UbiE